MNDVARDLRQHAKLCGITSFPNWLDDAAKEIERLDKEGKRSRAAELSWQQQCKEAEARERQLRIALQAIINRLSESDSWLASHLDAANIAREALSKMDTKDEP